MVIQACNCVYLLITYISVMVSILKSMINPLPPKFYQLNYFNVYIIKIYFLNILEKYLQAYTVSSFLTSHIHAHIIFFINNWLK